MYIYIYVYIYICVCVCVCVRVSICRKERRTAKIMEITKLMEWKTEDEVRHRYYVIKGCKYCIRSGSCCKHREILGGVESIK